MNVVRDFDDSRMYESIFGQQEPWNKSTTPGRFQKVGWDGYAMAYKIAADRLWAACKVDRSANSTKFTQ